MTEHYDDLPADMFKKEEFNKALMEHMTTDSARAILADVLAVRPGWVNNIQVTFRIEDFIERNKVWGVDEASETTFMHSVMKEFDFDGLMMVEIMTIMRKHKEAAETRKEIMREWYRTASKGSR